MTEALDRLIDAVEGPAAIRRSWASDVLERKHLARYVDFAANGGSLDAARALHDALLGKDCHFNLMEDEDAGGYQAEVYLSGWHCAGSSCPARAWLLAILKAYRAQINEA